MKGLIAPALLACLLLAGCPGGDSRQDRTSETQATEAGYGTVFKRLSEFEEELARLQALHREDADPASARTGNAQLQYKLGQRVREDSISIVLRDVDTGAEHVLQVWEDTVGDQDAPMPVNQQESAGGMVLDYQLDNEVFLSVSLRWVQDRYLEVRRTFEAGGLDMEFELGPGYTSWILGTAPLPYRLLPGPDGPFGVVPAQDAGGDWQGSSYPAKMMLPAIAAYDQSGGILLAVSDDHPREFDRSYSCDWRIAASQGDATDNAQLRIGYGIYNSTVDRYTEPILLSGLPQRDSIVIEPFSLDPTSAGDSFVTGTTEQVAGHMSDFISVFHARYSHSTESKPFTVLDIGNSLQVGSLTEEQFNEMLRLKTGLWNSQAVMADVRDGSLIPDGSGSPLIPESSSSLCNDFGIAQWRIISPFVLPHGSGLLASDPDLRLETDPPRDTPTDSPVALSIRRSETADRIMAGLESMAGGAVVLDMQLVQDGGQDPSRMPLACSQQAAAALMAMKTAEEFSKREKAPALAILGLPSIAFPACADFYILPPSVGGGMMGSRLLCMLANRLFGVTPLVGYGDQSPARAALSVTENSGGLVTGLAMLEYPGSDSMLQHSDGLFATAGSTDNYLLLHSEPRYGSYTMFGEAPAEPQQAVVAIPSRWEGRPDIFLLSIGTGLDAILDKEMQMLNMQLPSGESLLREMPFGMYEIIHPDPQAVGSGDVLVIHRDLITPESGDYVEGS